MTTTSGGFITGRWSHIAILNYRAEASLLTPLLPKGVELDSWNGQAFVSIVGLSFEHLRVLSVPVPFYRRFQQVNLRFYVRRTSGRDCRKGVVFIREFVPYRAMIAASRLLYNQRYCFARMEHHVETGPVAHELESGRCSSGEVPTAVEYCWRYSGRWNQMRVKAASSPEVPRAGSFEEFITRRPWGYCRRRNASLEFQVSRAEWLVSAGSGSLDCDPARVFGKDFAGLLSDEPVSAFLSPGSPIALSLATRCSAL
jgi:uncharacterized protein YqjF (DUF2071 family)